VGLASGVVAQAAQAPAHALALGQGERPRARVAAGPAAARLVAEVGWYRTLIASVYHAIPDVPGTEELQAELEREAARPGGRCSIDTAL
jgi:hypothetical protein